MSDAAAFHAAMRDICRRAKGECGHNATLFLRMVTELGGLEAALRRIQRHEILVVGSFIMGLDTDEPGVDDRIAATATHYGHEHPERTIS